MASAAQKNPTVSGDFYFFSGALEKPMVGEQARDAPVGAARKNEKDGPNKPDQIVAAPSGDMAYQYDTARISFDDWRSGW